MEFPPVIDEDLNSDFSKGMECLTLLVLMPSANTSCKLTRNECFQAGRKICVMFTSAKE